MESLNFNDKNLNLEFIKNLSWQEVFDIWRSNEENKPGWQETAKNKGYENWEEWRINYFDVFKCREAKWALYEIKNPLEVVPRFHGGPFRTWIEKFYNGEFLPTFSRLVEFKQIQKHPTIMVMADDFYADTTLTGLILGGEIYIIEGTHRCCALALIAKENKPLNHKIFIALAEYLGDKLPEMVSFNKSECP